MSEIKVSAPGSIMLTGEHAVLHGYQAAACAVNKRIFMTVRENLDFSVRIKSQLGTFQTALDKLPVNSQFNFIIEAIREIKLQKGIDIETSSEFSHKTGLGSSAAVTVCICKALNLLLKRDISDDELFMQAYKVVHGVQHTGSGCDLAASIFGGIIAMKQRNGEFVPRKLSVPILPSIDLFYCGYKMKTPDVIALVNKKAAIEPEKYEKLYSEMGKIADKTVEEMENGDIPSAGKLFDQYQILMEKLGVCDENISDILQQLHKASGIMGAKISGSGLGDCVMSLGIPEPKPSGYLNIPVEISSTGVSEW